jgi:UDP-N-acetylenolpyruvoylglucosamine reductase
MVSKAAEDCCSGAEKSRPALFASRVALAIWIEDGHMSIFEGKAGIQAKTFILLPNISIYLHRRWTGMFTVMGITGNVGGAVAENLLAPGKAVRNPEKANAWADRGVELVQSATMTRPD